MPLRATRTPNERIDDGHVSQPVLLESDPARLARLHAGLGRAGIDVHAVARIADIERWPSDTFVITDSERFTPWWRTIGATCVIVLADSREQGVAACQHGATAWLARDCSVSKLVQTVKVMCTAEVVGQSDPAKVVRGVVHTRRIRIIRPVAGVMDGVSLSALWPGLIYEVPLDLAAYLVGCGAAEDSAPTRPVSVVPADDPYIAHVVGGVIVTQKAPQPQDVAADGPPKARRIRKRKDRRR
jgi:hypothetical protein